MQQVKLTDDALAAIQQGATEIQAVDDAGRVCGYVISTEYRAKIHGWLAELFRSPTPNSSPDPRGYSTSEAIAYLRGVEAGFKRAS